jgi:hypothetical protein
MSDFHRWPAVKIGAAPVNARSSPITTVSKPSLHFLPPALTPPSKIRGITCKPASRFQKAAVKE